MAAIESLSANIDANVSFTARKTVGGIIGGFGGTLLQALQLTLGTGANQINQAYYRKGLSIGAGGTLVVDLSGTEKNAFGDNIVMTKLKTILVINRSTTATIIQVGAGSAPVPFLSDAASDKVPVQPNGGVFLLAAPDANGLADITATTADAITITNTDGSNPASVDVIYLGVE